MKVYTYWYKIFFVIAIVNYQTNDFKSLLTFVCLSSFRSPTRIQMINCWKNMLCTLLLEKWLQWGGLLKTFARNWGGFLYTYDQYYNSSMGWGLTFGNYCKATCVFVFKYTSL